MGGCEGLGGVEFNPLLLNFTCDLANVNCVICAMTGLIRRGIYKKIEAFCRNLLIKINEKIAFISVKTCPRIDEIAM
jgi:hypothetical protein